MPQIQTIGLHKTYSDGHAETPVLKGIDLTIERGETIGIVGASGAGKSTLLHLIGTLDRPTRGDILFNGKALFKLSEKERSVFRNRHLGFVFQFHHLLPDFTALENVMMPLLIDQQAKSSAVQRAGDLLQKVGLQGKEGSRPGQLSGGEQQRVAIARALAHSPEVILADEPTGNLDADNGNKVFDLLLGLNKELNSTLIVVTHNFELTARLGKTVRLADGKIVSSP